MSDREVPQHILEADLHDKEVLRLRRILLTYIFTIVAASAMLFHFYELQHLRENFFTLAPAMQYLIRNVLDYIGNIEPTFAIGGLLPVVLDAGLTGVETVVSVIKGERYEVPYKFRYRFMVTLFTMLSIYNVDTETGQKLLGSYGEANIKDIFPGSVGILSAALMFDAMRTAFRTISAQISSRAIQLCYNTPQVN